MPSERTIKRIVKYAGQIKDIDPASLREVLEIASLHHKVEQAIEVEFGGRGLTARQVGILEVLYHLPDVTLTPADLAAEVGLTRSAMTSALDSLEESGYISRGRHPSDRRMIAISLTASGRKFISGYLPERYRKVCGMIGCISKSNRRAVARSFAKVLEFFAREKERAGRDE